MDVKPTATTTEIKKSYRRLVMKYHPDKNPGDSIAEAAFKAIAEAYEILSNPTKRQAYDYKNIHSYTNKEPPAVTRDSIAKSVAKLQQTVAAADPFRTNTDALYFQVQQILTADNIAILKKENDEYANRQLVAQLLQCSRLLPFAQANKICELLLQIAGRDETAVSSINSFLQSTYRSNQWDKYKALVAIIAAIILCLIIFLLKK